MLFNSYEFIFGFLPLTVLVFFGLARFRYLRLSAYWLTLTSIVFYGYWNPAYLPLLLISVIGNFLFGQWISRTPSQTRSAKILLGGGIAFNLAILGYYKYAEFFLSSLSSLIGISLSVPDILLPLGISFYSFTQIAYLVDAYSAEARAFKYDFHSYLLFIIFFPQLIAGPILRHDELIPEFQKTKNYVFSHKNLFLGLTTFTLGLAKKVLIADRLSPWVGQVFAQASDVTFIEAWIGAISYTFQLYFDFSGYSDMAIGLGLIFNLSLPINFDSPYKSTSIVEFWRRWHITLSHFLRDYLYIPLGGSRKGEVRRYGNLILTMLLGGLWHGAGWTYIVWGGLHGTYLAINHGWRKLGYKLPTIVAWAIAFTSIIVGWVVFRAASLQDASELLKAMFGWKGIVLTSEFQPFLPGLSALGVQFRTAAELLYLPPDYQQNLLFLIGLLGVVVFAPNTQQIVQKIKPTVWWAVALGLLATTCLLSLNRVSEFLYFQF